MWSVVHFDGALVRLGSTKVICGQLVLLSVTKLFAQQTARGSSPGSEQVRCWLGLSRVMNIRFFYGKHKRKKNNIQIRPISGYESEDSVLASDSVDDKISRNQTPNIIIPESDDSDTNEEGNNAGVEDKDERMGLDNEVENAPPNLTECSWKKQNRIDLRQQLLRLYTTDPAEFFDRLVTVDESWSRHETPEEKLPWSGRKKKYQADTSCCPVCGVSVRPGELETHYVQELERLYKVTSGNRVRRLTLESRSSLSSSAMSCLPRREGVSSTVDGTPEGRWDTYQRIKANRQGRLRIKNRKRKADEATCPVCSERMQGSVEELNAHVEVCLRKHGGTNDEDDINVDVEGDTEMFEEYEWAGQRRIRATTLLVGGFAAAGLATSSSRRSPVDEDVDLVVDGDDTATYGPPQYSEADVIMTSADGPREAKERDALREAIISPDGSKQPTPAGNGANSGSSSSSTEVDVKEEPQSSDTFMSGEGGQIVEALKSRIRELEEVAANAVDEKFKCLICMERYKKPVISVCCWHVHCEECWLHTLGAKKLCPQCNMITSPSDLRRIYM
ncbi:E3 ubiquitin-protein ligase Rnf220 [Anabrus simplex]|uniref:E3 ubiquitin-protein ligase Rnf220 n=1 Tax=Anabrus simplex TaxID=316456 RepID=UPI0035A3C72E